MRMDRVFMSEDMADEVMPIHCERCGGFRFREKPHTEEDCNLHRVWEIQES